MKLEIRVIKQMPEFTINVSFSCNAGEMQIITGPSGSGKTTIMRILAGLERADYGFIRFGDTVWEDTARKIFIPPQKREIGYVFQEYSLFPHLTVEQNISFAVNELKNVDFYLRYFALQHLVHRYPRQLSGGERQRVALAQALARDPKLLLLDEPFSALDFMTKEKLMMCLNNLRDSINIPIIHITHDLNKEICKADRFVPLEKGMISYDWLPEAVRQSFPEDQRQEALCLPPGTKAHESPGRLTGTVSHLFGFFKAYSPQ